MNEIKAVEFFIQFSIWFSFPAADGAAYQDGKLRSNKDYELDFGGYYLKNNVNGKTEL